MIVRKSIKLLIAIVALIVVIVAVTAIFISPVAERYIESHSKELIGRQVLMDKLHINIFNGSLKVVKLRMYEKDDKTVFASIDSFAIRLNLFPLLQKNLDIARISIIRPYAEILQNGNKFNFDDLMKKDSSDKPSDPNAFPRKIILRNILLNGGRLVYTDQQLGNTIRLKNMGVSIPLLAFGGGRSNAGIKLKIGDATVRSKTTMNMSDNTYSMLLQIDHLPVNIIKPYIESLYSIGDLKGTADCRLVVKGSSDHIMSFRVSGTVRGKNLAVSNRKGEPIVSIGSLATDIDSIAYDRNTYIFRTMTLQNAHLYYFLYPKTDNFTAFLTVPNAKVEKKSSASEPPMVFRIGELNVQSSEMTYEDHTMHETFVFPVTHLSLVAHHFSMNGNNSFEGTASLSHGGRLSLNWSGNFDDMRNQQFLIALRNFNLPDVSPYCMEYTARHITGGNMNFTSRNRIADNHINSLNTIDIFDINVDKKHKDFKAEYSKVPLKAALFVLKDKDGKIQFDVPVKGSLDDPEFSYRKIVFKTIFNLLVKVAVSPVRFFASQFGLDGDKLAQMSIDPLQSELTAEQYAKLDQIAQLFAKKSGLKLAMTQCADWKEALDDYAQFTQKQAFLASQHPERKVPATYEETKNVKDGDEAFKTFCSSHPAASAELLSADLLNLLTHRNGELIHYLTTTCGIDPSRLVVTTMSADSLKSYSGKDEFKIDFALPEQSEDKDE